MSEDQYLTIPTLEQRTGIRHAFTTRQSGLGARNSGFKLPEDWNAVAGFFSIDPDRVVTVNQVHGETIIIVDDKNFRTMRSVQADAMITNTPGIAIGVETADCVPILLYAPEVSVVGAVHAGWRSTVQKIVQKAVIKIRDEFRADPAEMIAAIGPAIGPECYEVDDPVMVRVREAFSFWKDLTASRGNDRWSLNLAKANKMELIQAGLQEKNIHSLGMCTCCRKDLFYSFRAEGRTGRMLSAIMIKR